MYDPFSDARDEKEDSIHQTSSILLMLRDMTNSKLSLQDAEKQPRCSTRNLTFNHLLICITQLKSGFSTTAAAITQLQKARILRGQTGVGALISLTVVLADPNNSQAGLALQRRRSFSVLFCRLAVRPRAQHSTVSAWRSRITSRQARVLQTLCRLHLFRASFSANPR